MSPPAHNAYEGETDTATQEVARLKAILQAESRTHRQPAIRMHYVIAAWCLIVPYTVWKAWESVLEDRWAEALGWAALLGLSTQLHRIAQSRRQTRATQKLARAGNVTAVGVLAEALEWPDTNTRKSAIEGLTDLLPRLDAGNASQLNPHQRECLYRMLQLSNARRYGELLKAILKALEQVGDEAALPIVQRLAKSQAAGSAQRQVVAAAQHCLPLLQNRIQEMRSSQTLLRASAPTPAGAAELLRPAGENAPTAPQQLLRASDKQESQDR